MVQLLAAMMAAMLVQKMECSLGLNKVDQLDYCSGIEQAVEWVDSMEYQLVGNLEY